MSEFQDFLRVPLSLASPGFLDDLTANMYRAGVVQAVADRNTAAIFDWLIEVAQLQGISDAAAFAFTDRNGLPTFHKIENALGSASCPLLKSYWHYHECGFRKSHNTCATPVHIERCPVPALPARNGRLAQAAVSLFLFIRDVCGGDVVGWIDGRLAQAEQLGRGQNNMSMSAALLDPLRNVFGVSDKVLSMSLADLLLVGDPNRQRWLRAGASMIAIDTLVHNYLHRTGATRALGRPHVYGPACYAPGGCADLIRDAAAAFDAKTINRCFPSNFPRFVQHAVWNFCAAGGWNICNGNQVDDRHSCRASYCPAGPTCKRVALDDLRARNQSLR